MALERSISERKKSSFLIEDYFSGLKGEAEKRRYSEKLSYIGGLDPYYTKDWVDEVDLWPTISHIDIGMYLLLTPSPYSGNELRNYKSMDCYRNFLAGWVRDIHVMSVTVESTDTRVVISKVTFKLVLWYCMYNKISLIIGKSFTKTQRQATHPLDCS